MANRGRKSIASLATVTPTSPRPEPPEHLSEAESAEWRDIAARMPPDWFTRESWPLLEAYCHHVVTRRLLARELAGFDRERLAEPEGLKRYDKLTAIAARESNILATLATKLRLSQQSRYGPRAAHSAAQRGTVKKPWET